MRTSSLDMREEKNKEDHDNRLLKMQVEDASKAIKILTMELSELQKSVRFILICFLNLIWFSLAGDGIPCPEASNEFYAKLCTSTSIESITEQYFRCFREFVFLSVLLVFFLFCLEISTREKNPNQTLKF